MMENLRKFRLFLYHEIGAGYSWREAGVWTMFQS